MTTRIAIFASGSGSNAENIVRYFNEHPIICVSLIVSNRQDAFVLQRAKQLGIPSVVHPKADWLSGEPVLRTLREHQIDFIVLAGFLLRVPECLLITYPYRIINIHPALLPKYGGKGMYGSRVHEAVVAAHETESGITIHYVNERYDEGIIIRQERCPVTPADTPDDVAERVHALEYRYFPSTIEDVIASCDALSFAP
ncbi:MAG: phosphoribosylglycinamide formyltransferase [Prevotellaceae bacterium]|jgi:phosphoribosylglycinamide formyltransferase-1|nr:phosphoribosylglycinamide formyltransferase [Prevotellaceae bacterium]